MVNDEILCSIRCLVEEIEDTEDETAPIWDDAKKVREWLDGA